jgi:hypothetical protein
MTNSKFRETDPTNIDEYAENIFTRINLAFNILEFDGKEFAQIWVQAENKPNSLQKKQRHYFKRKQFIRYRAETKRNRIPQN